MNMKILKTETSDDHAEIIDISGKGADRFEVAFQIIYNDKKYYIAFQCADRSDNKRAYSGYEMSPAQTYCFEIDQSQEMFEDNDCDDGVTSALEILEKKASELCKKYLNEQLNKAGAALK